MVHRCGWVVRSRGGRRGSRSRAGKLEASEEAFEEEDSNLEFAALPKGLKDTVAKQKPKVEDTVAKQKPKKVGNRKEKQKPEVPARSSPRRKKMEEELLEILEANE